jgi:glycerol-3-phosphate cytidylyltransferase
MENKVIYVDGTFDLLHPGHIAFLKECKKYGNYLIVGVISDQNVQSYKRIPILSLDHRCIMLENIIMVDKVIKDCPFFGITQEFINKYQIEKVIYSGGDLGKWEEHYKIPIKNNMMINLPYDVNETGCSTSKIIKTIVLRNI